MEPERSTANDDLTEALPKDEARTEMMRRIKRMTVEERVELFERMSRDAAWIRSATRLR